MTLKVAVISKQTIKPSSPTPPHLKNVKLSLLDQYNPPIPISAILFYTANDLDNKHKPADHLKRSLSQTLSYFYPFAGRVSDDNQIIDCNDEGVSFFETQVNARLNQVLESPIREELDQLISTDNFDGEGPKVLLSVQTNLFDCGGMALTVTTSHKVADGSTLAFLLTVWNEVARGDKVTLHPIFNISTIFPPKAVSTLPRYHEDKKLVGKRFVFDSVNVAALKSKCSNKSYVEHPTRVEAVSALIWRCTMNVLRMRPESPPKLASIMNLSVNLRPLMTPPLLNNSCGNSAIVTRARSSTTETKHSELQYLVAQLREAKGKVDADYVRGLDIDAWVAEMIAFYRDNGGEFETYTISILCKFPFYQLDFGWGKPTWVCMVMVGKNLIQMVDTKCGEGVEVWSEEDMATFESDPDLIAFTVANPMVKNSHLMRRASRI